MITKDGLMSTIKTLGFFMDKQASKGGSHRVFRHKTYKNLYMGIVDHQNTKEVTRTVYNQVVKTVTLLMWLKYRDKDNKVDLYQVKDELQNIDNELAKKVLSQLKKLNTENQVNFSLLLCDSIANNIQSCNNGVLTLDNVINYCSSID